MPDILRIPPNTKAFLKAVYDEVEGVFDVTEFAYDFRRTGGLWGYWKFDETSGNRLPALGGCPMEPWSSSYADVEEPPTDALAWSFTGFTTLEISLWLMDDDTPSIPVSMVAGSSVTVGINDTFSLSLNPASFSPGVSPNHWYAARYRYDGGTYQIAGWFHYSDHGSYFTFSQYLDGGYHFTHFHTIRFYGLPYPFNPGWYICHLEYTCSLPWYPGDLPGYAAGKFGNALTLPESTRSPGTTLVAFDGSPSFLDDYDLYQGEFEPPWSVAFWFKVNGTAGYNSGFDFWMSAFCIYFDGDGSGKFQAWAYEFGDGETEYLWDCDVWHLCVVTCGEGVGTLYIDNVAVDTGEVYYGLTSGTDFGFENAWDPTSVCAVDEFSLWNDCLTPSQVSALWNNGAGLQLA